MATTRKAPMGRRTAKTSTRPARKTARTAAKRPAASRNKAGRRPSRSTTPRTARRSRPSRQAVAEEPMEFVELPISGSSGSSYEPDSYTPKADLVPRKRKAFFGLFG